MEYKHVVHITNKMDFNKTLKRISPLESGLKTVSYEDIKKLTSSNFCICVDKNDKVYFAPYKDCIKTAEKFVQAKNL